MSRGPDRPTTLLGRRTECEALDAVLADASAGESRAIILRGDPGVGKSALLGYVSDRAAAWHVATVVGVESEMELDYSGLHQLCAPMLDRLDGLPGPQRDALATGTGLRNPGRSSGARAASAGAVPKLTSARHAGGRGASLMRRLISSTSRLTSAQSWRQPS
jgi:hypothetical protein